MKELQLSQGFTTMVDDDLFPFLNRWKWYYHKGRAVRGIWHPEFMKREKIYLSRFIMQCPSQLFVDHKNGNPLDNRCNNLRICTKAQNNQNRKKILGRSSKYKGVTKVKDSSKWSVSLTKNYKRIAVGCFNSEVEAAKAYNLAALKAHGEFAKLNIV